jgi:hypothetical protein
MTTESKSTAPTWSSKEVLAPGIIVYRDVIKKEIDVINRLESNLGSVAEYGSLSPEGKRYHWMPAYVGYQQLIPDYRDCVDFKFKKTDIIKDTSEESLKLQALWQDVYDAQYPAVVDYCKAHNLMELKYWEAFNFIKYGENQHFMEHQDHGYSYNCVVSLVAYINDDYDNGELYFRLQDLNIKPKAGDLYVFPSNFMYAHQAKPVTNGIKYSIVTMLDYSKKFHTPDMYDPKWDNEVNENNSL